MGAAGVKKRFIMATPWADPRTGRLYLRRQIPATLRPAFGGRAVFKISLRSKDVAEARAAFARENAAFEQRLSAARLAVADGAVAPNPAGLVKRWFDGPAVDGGLPGPRRLLLALMSLDTMVVEWLGDECAIENEVAPASTDWLAVARDSDSLDHLLATHYRDDVGRVGMGWETIRMDENLNGLGQEFVAGLRPQLTAFDAAATGYPTETLVDALLARLDVVRSGKLADIVKRPVPPRERKEASRLRPTMRLRQLFREWKDGAEPRPQTALEYEAAVDDFVDFAGDPPVAAIGADLLYDYRDEAAKLPKAMPRADRALPFRERIAKFSEAVPKASPATLKKRIGALQALLTYAFQQRWTADNAGRGVQIVGYTKNRRSRRSFEDHELTLLCSGPLFTDPATWGQSGSRITDPTLFWLFLLAITSGARLEEVGQALISDVREAGDIVYLDIDCSPASSSSAGKSVKTDDSIRLVPIHNELIRLGFLAYRDALVAAGHTQLFPDLKENSVGKRTKEASQRANRIIDRSVADDSRLVFHSLRHAFKAKGNDAGLSDRTLDQICGHAPVSTGGRYGSEPRIRTIHRELHLVDFSCIDWAGIRHKLGDADWAKIVQMPGRPHRQLP